MTEIAKGALVKHVSLGVGKVVAVEPTAVHVFFADSEKRYAAKLRLPAASALLTSDGVEANPWLQGLTTFAFDAQSGRYALAANFLTHDEAVAEFLQIYPGGFADPAYAGDGKRERSSRWRAACAEWKQALGGGEGERLLADGDLAEVARRALRAAGHASRIPGIIDSETLAEALEPGEVVKGFFEALFALLSTPVPTRPRVEKVFTASEALGVDPEAAWPMATLFQFLADPEHHMVVLPKLAGGAAARLGSDLKLKPTPNWGTYAALRGLSEQLLEKLRPNGARDLVDVESFLHAIATRRAASATKRTAAAAPKTAPDAAKDGRAAAGAAPRKKR